MNSTENDQTSKQDTRWTMITVTYNNAETLSTHWADSRPTGVEWLVVDNASSDGSAEIAEELGARVIRLSSNVGFSRANNVGLEAAKGEFIAFVNPDVIVDWKSLLRLERTIQDNRAFVAPQLIYPDKSLQPNGRGAPSLYRKFRNRLGPSSNSSYQVFAHPGEQVYVAWCIGAAIASTRENIQDIGGWDGSYFIYYEDADFCLRAWAQGYRVILDGSVNWKHSWARATTRFRLSPWKREFASAFRFYSREKALLISHNFGSRNRDAFVFSGQRVTAGEPS